MAIWIAFHVFKDSYLIYAFVSLGNGGHLVFILERVMSHLKLHQPNPFLYILYLNKIWLNQVFIVIVLWKYGIVYCLIIFNNGIGFITIIP